MLRSKHDAALHVGLGHTRKHADEVKHYLSTRMGDNSQVGIDAFGHLGSEFNLQLAVVLFLIFHYCIVIC